MNGIPAHITLDEAGARIDCTECSMGMDAPPMFGPIPRADLVAAFIVQHADHNARGMPNGMTAGGRPTKRVAAAMRAWDDEPDDDEPSAFREWQQDVTA